jgi:hypothetical protein
VNTLTRVFNVLCMSAIFCNVLPMQDSELDMQDSKPDLWQVIKGCHSTGMLESYLARGADATKLNNKGFCLLHGLVYENAYGRIDNVNDFLKKGEVLINAIPDKLNALNERGETPVDAALVGLGTSKCMKYGSHGGKTAQELKESHLS